MPLNATLAGKTIVVTRPLAQSQNIFELLEARQANVIHFPVISISPANDIDKAKQCFSSIADDQIIIFISANAVHYAMKTAQELGIDLNHSTLAAVGPATKTALENYGCKVSIVPAAGFSSEALLSDAALHDIEQQQILIVRGEGGREHLRETLEARKAQVRYAEVYRRELPSTRNTIDLSQLAANNTAILLYSVESAQNLWALCTAAEKQFLTNITVIAGSKRIAEAVTTLGFAIDSIIAENPSDEAMLAAVHSWA